MQESMIILMLNRLHCGLEALTMSLCVWWQFALVYSIYGFYGAHVHIKKIKLEIPNLNLHRRCGGFVEASEMHSRTFFFLCEVPKYRSSCTVCRGVRDFTQLYRMWPTKQGYGLCWNCKWSPLWACCWCACTHQHAPYLVKLWPVAAI